MKQVIWLTVVAFCWFCASPFAQAEETKKTASETVAEVNGTPITRDALADTAISLVGAQALEMLISKELILQEAAAQKVTVTKEEIDAYTRNYIEEKIAILAQQRGFPSIEKFAEWMEQSGTSMADLRSEIKATVLPFAEPQLLARKLIRKTIKISGEEVRTEFDYRYGPKAEVQQIVLRTRKEAEDVLEKLRKGADFAELVRQYSIDPVSRRRDGMLPPLPKASLLGGEAFKLKPGQFSDIIKLDASNTLHIIKLVGLLPAESAKKFDEHEEKIREELITAAIVGKQMAWLKQLADKADIKRHL